MASYKKCIFVQYLNPKFRFSIESTVETIGANHLLETPSIVPT